MSLRESEDAGRLRSVRRPPIDRDHLRRQTFGDADLERTVLGLFVTQLGTCIERIRTAESVAARGEAAHALLGSARGVGASSVASIAAGIEGARGPVGGRLAALERAAGEARAAIAAMLAGAGGPEFPREAGGSGTNPLYRPPERS